MMLLTTTYSPGQDLNILFREVFQNSLQIVNFILDDKN